MSSPGLRSVQGYLGVSSSSYEDPGPIGLGPHSMTSFNLHYLLEGPIPNTLGIRASTSELWRHNSAHHRMWIERDILCSPYTMRSMSVLTNIRHEGHLKYG